MFFVVDNWFSINDETMTIALENSNMPLSQYCPNHDCSDCKIIPSLWAQVGMEEAAYCVFDCVLPTTTTTTTKPHPSHFSLSPCGPRSLWQKQLADLIFKKKKRPRQNWSRGHFEATQRAKFSILKPNFWSGDAAMGMAHWHNPNIVNFFSYIR